MKTNPSISLERLIGSSVTFNCEAEGTEPIKYRWFMGSAVADWITTGQGVRGPILTIDRVGREHTGQYTCQVSNSVGSLNYTYRLLVSGKLSRLINNFNIICYLILFDCL